MTKTITKYILLLTSACSLGLLACKRDLVEPNEITVSGDFTGKLNVFLPNNSQSNTTRLSSISDSSSINYPAFYFEVSQEFALVFVRESANTSLIRYYAVKPSVEISANNNKLRLDELKLTQGDGILTNEIINKDDSKTIILDGKIER